MDQNHHSQNETVKQMAQFCETVFNSQQFQNLFTGDFNVDEQIYLCVGGALMRYVNVTKDFDLNKVFRIFNDIKQSDVFEQMNPKLSLNNERRIFNDFFAPEVLKIIKAQNHNVVDATADYLMKIFNQYVFTNSFNGYHVDRVKAEGFDCSKADPFEKEYELLGKFLGKTKYSANGTYFADPSYITMRFCQTSPERLYVMLYDQVTRHQSENLKDFLWRRFKQKIDDLSVKPEAREKLMENKTEISQAVEKITQAYGNETAGIAMISYANFVQLCNEDTRQEFASKRAFYDDEILTEKEKIKTELKNNVDVQRQDERLIDLITCSVCYIDLCKGGIGKCIRDKISPEMIGVAQIPQCGLLSLNQQRVLNKIQTGTEKA